MKKYMWLIIILFIGSFFIYADPFQSAPYSPVIKTEEKETVDVTEGSYCWGSRFMFQCVDKVFTSAIDMAEAADLIEVRPGEVLIIDYSRKPMDGTLELTLWKSETEQERVEVNNMQFTAPSEPGEYVYEMRANWKKGDGIHAFRINVVPSSN